MISEIVSPEDPRFVELLEIYHEAFPPETREPDQRLVEELRGEYRIAFRFLVWEDRGVAGFVRFAALPKTKAGFIIHIAVAPDRQREGIGRKLLEAATLELGDQPLIAEVEDGEALAWWTEKAGVSVISPTYTQPALRADTDEVPLNLTARGKVRDPRQLVEKFYAELWELPFDHPYVVKAVEGIS